VQTPLIIISPSPSKERGIKGVRLKARILNLLDCELIGKYAITAKMSGKVYLVGVGPGSRDDMTTRAMDVLKKVAVVIGHRESLDLIKGLIFGKEVISREMTPVERSRIAIAKAQEGSEVAVVSSGDPGIYAIASTFFGYLREKGLEADVEVIPGVTVASAAAALLGSPLGHDFAVISLADLATGWETIKKRLESAASSDFVIVLYNPRGKVGDRRLREALGILMTFRKATTPVGIATRATTEQAKVQMTTLADVSPADIDIDTLLIIGNSETFVFNGRMVTPRDYEAGIGY
jgi:precorrin-3B C17-methyltransferase